MREFLVLFILGMIAIALVAPDQPSRAQKAYTATVNECRSSWKDSGYKWRVVKPFPDLDRVFACQVQINGHWFPEENVKVGK